MIVILHNIRSLHNVGSIFRTADAIEIEKIYLSGITPTPIDIFNKPRQQLIKTSLGAEKSVKWEKIRPTNNSAEINKMPSSQKTIKLLKDLKKMGYKIISVEQDKKSVPYYKISKSYILNSKLCLILGNELEGLPKSILKNSDKILEIPMNGKKESLNVSVAFGIIAFHLVYAKK